MKYVFIYTAVVILNLFLFVALETGVDKFVRAEENYSKKNLKYTQQIIQRSLRDQIILNSRLLSASFIDNNGLVKKTKHLTKAINQVQQLYPSITTVNYVAPNGKIVWVHPEATNKAALGKNLLQRNDVAPFLLGAKKTKQMHITNVIDTYQGYKGVAFYYPLYEKNKFIGWMNILFNHDKWREHFSAKYMISSKDINLTSPDNQHPPKDIYVNEDGKLELKSTFQVLNQSLQLTITNTMSTKSKHFYLIVCSSRLALLLLFLAAIASIRQNQILQRKNNKLEIGRILINTLSHDLATPISILEMVIHRLKDKLSPKETNKLMYSIERLKSILIKSRDIQKSELHDTLLEVHKFQVKEAVEKSYNCYKEKAQDKNITTKINIPDNLYILADPEVFHNNVLNNIIDNAIKFSNENSIIKICAEYKNSKVYLHIHDQGCGIPQVNLDKLKTNKKLLGGTGTKGEKGSGLGWIQIYYFTQRMNGDVKIKSISDPNSAERGTIVTLIMDSAHPTEG